MYLNYGGEGEGSKMDIIIKSFLLFWRVPWSESSSLCHSVTRTNVANSRLPPHFLCPPDDGSLHSLSHWKNIWKYEDQIWGWIVHLPVKQFPIFRANFTSIKPVSMLFLPHLGYFLFKKSIYIQSFTLTNIFGHKNIVNNILYLQTNSANCFKTRNIL